MNTALGTTGNGNPPANPPTTTPAQSAPAALDDYGEFRAWADEALLESGRRWNAQWVAFTRNHWQQLPPEVQASFATALREFRQVERDFHNATITLHATVERVIERAGTRMPRGATTQLHQGMHEALEASLVPATTAVRVLEDLADLHQYGDIGDDMWNLLLAYVEVSRHDRDATVYLLRTSAELRDGRSVSDPGVNIAQQLAAILRREYTAPASEEDEEFADEDGQDDGNKEGEDDEVEGYEEEKEVEEVEEEEAEEEEVEEREVEEEVRETLQNEEDDIGDTGNKIVRVRTGDGDDRDDSDDSDDSDSDDSKYSEESDWGDISQKSVPPLAKRKADHDLEDGRRVRSAPVLGARPSDLSEDQLDAAEMWLPRHPDEPREIDWPLPLEEFPPFLTLLYNRRRRGVLPRSFLVWCQQHFEKIRENRLDDMDNLESFAKAAHDEYRATPVRDWARRGFITQRPFHMTQVQLLRHLIDDEPQATKDYLNRHLDNAMDGTNVQETARYLVELYKNNRAKLIDWDQVRDMFETKKLAVSVTSRLPLSGATANGYWMVSTSSADPSFNGSPTVDNVIASSSTKSSVKEVMAARCSTSSSTLPG